MLVFGANKNSSLQRFDGVPKKFVLFIPLPLTADEIPLFRDSEIPVTLDDFNSRFKREIDIRGIIKYEQCYRVPHFCKQAGRLRNCFFIAAWKIKSGTGNYDMRETGQWIRILRLICKAWF